MLNLESVFTQKIWYSLFSRPLLSNEAAVNKFYSEDSTEMNKMNDNI